MRRRAPFASAFSSPLSHTAATQNPASQFDDRLFVRFSPQRRDILDFLNQSRPCGSYAVDKRLTHLLQGAIFWMRTCGNEPKSCEILDSISFNLSAMDFLRYMVTNVE